MVFYLQGVPKKNTTINFSMLYPFWPFFDLLMTLLTPYKHKQTLFYVLIIISYQLKLIKRVFRISKKLSRFEKGQFPSNPTFFAKSPVSQNPLINPNWFELKISFSCRVLGSSKGEKMAKKGSKVKTSLLLRFLLDTLYNFQFARLLLWMCACLCLCLFFQQVKCPHHSGYKLPERSQFF